MHSAIGNCKGQQGRLNSKTVHDLHHCIWDTILLSICHIPNNVQIHTRGWQVESRQVGKFRVAMQVGSFQQPALARLNPACRIEGRILKPTRPQTALSDGGREGGTGTSATNCFSDTILTIYFMVLCDGNKHQSKHYQVTMLALASSRISLKNDTQTCFYIL